MAMERTFVHIQFKEKFGTIVRNAKNKKCFGKLLAMRKL